MNPILRKKVKVKKMMSAVNTAKTVLKNDFMVQI